MMQNKRQFLIFILMLVFFIPTSFAGDLKKANKAYVDGDYETAHKELSSLAEDGHSEAQFTLGFMYHFGKGVAQNYAETAKWYRRAADQGYAKAQYNLGNLYRDGFGVPQDLLRASMWYELATRSGDVFAVFDRDAIASSLSPTQRLDVQELANRCLASNYQDC
jgi:TPR repeat protein